jgi:hypothetical protein
VTLLDPPLRGRKTKPLTKLKEVVFKCPQGIERDECERLKSLVRKVKVYA